MSSTTCGRCAVHIERLVFVIKLAGFSILLSIFPAFWSYGISVVAEYLGWMPEDAMSQIRVDRQAWEPPLQNRTSSEKYVKYLSLSLFAGPLAIAFAFHPFVLRWYITPREYPLKSMVVMFFFCAFLFLYGFGYHGSRLAMFVCPFVPILGSCAILKYFFPDCLIHKHLLSQAVFFVVGTTLISLVQYFPNDSDLFLTIQLVLFYPVFREATRYLAILSSWYLSSDQQVGGQYLKNLGRQHAWVFIGWLQVFWACFYRLALTGLTDSSITFCIVAFQAVQEIVTRLTMEKRDLFFKRKMKSMRGLTLSSIKERPGTRVVPLHATMKSYKLRKGKETTPVFLGDPSRNYDQGKTDFYSLIILTEMMAEYAGIVTSAILIAINADRPLYSPYAWYVSADMDEEFDLTPLYFACAFQVAVEIVVDCFCLHYEKRTDARKALNDMVPKKSFCILFTLCCFYGTTWSHSYVAFSDNLSACAGDNMCHCVNNGLAIKGARESYCKLIYPDINWSNPPFNLTQP